MTTPILELKQPAQGVDNWHIQNNANFGAIDSKLGQAYRNMWEEGGITYISNNAKYVTDHWERWDNLKGAWLIELEESVKTEYYCAAGSGTITWLDDPDVYINYLYTKFIVASAGTTIRKTDATEFVSANNIWTKLNSFIIPSGYSLSGNNTFTITVDAKTNGFGGYVKVYRNGVSVGVAKIIDTVYTNYSDDVDNWIAGDSIEIWGIANSAPYNAHIKNFTIKSTNTVTQVKISNDVDPVW